MRAMQLKQANSTLQLVKLPIPEPTAEQILVRVSVCGVCRTDLHVVDGELSNCHYPIVPGHQIVGYVHALCNQVKGFKVGDRIGIPWLAHTCGHCFYCLSNKENLCETAQYTGCDINGGFAEYCVADYRYCFQLPENYSDLQVAPLLCAGLIGYRAYRLVKDAKRLGLIGFGASAHILTQLAMHQGHDIFAFTRPGDQAAQDFARSLGTKWAGGSDEVPPEQLDAVIIFAPIGALVPTALQLVRKGGCVVCAGIHMSDIPTFPYRLLWGERQLFSVANLTRIDGIEFLKLAEQVPIKTDVHPYPLEACNEALDDLRHGRFTGAAVIIVSDDKSV